MNGLRNFDERHTLDLTRLGVYPMHGRPAASVAAHYMRSRLDRCRYCGNVKALEACDLSQHPTLEPFVWDDEVAS